jgi:hypothetical protein
MLRINLKEAIEVTPANMCKIRSLTQLRHLVLLQALAPDINNANLEELLRPLHCLHSLVLDLERSNLFVEGFTEGGSGRGL